MVKTVSVFIEDHAVNVRYKNKKNAEYSISEICENLKISLDDFAHVNGYRQINGYVWRLCKNKEILKFSESCFGTAQLSFNGEKGGSLICLNKAIPVDSLLHTQKMMLSGMLRMPTNYITFLRTGEKCGNLLNYLHTEEGKGFGIKVGREFLVNGLWAYNYQGLKDAIQFANSQQYLEFQVIGIWLLEGQMHEKNLLKIKGKRTELQEMVSPVFLNWLNALEDEDMISPDLSKTFAEQSADWNESCEQILSRFDAEEYIDNPLAYRAYHIKGRIQTLFRRLDTDEKFQEALKNAPDADTLTEDATYEIFLNPFYDDSHDTGYLTALYQDGCLGENFSLNIPCLRGKAITEELSI